MKRIDSIITGMVFGALLLLMSCKIIGLTIKSETPEGNTLIELEEAEATE